MFIDVVTANNSAKMNSEVHKVVLEPLKMEVVNVFSFILNPLKLKLKVHILMTS